MLTIIKKYPASWTAIVLALVISGMMYHITVTMPKLEATMNELHVQNEEMRNQNADLKQQLEKQNHVFSEHQVQFDKLVSDYSSLLDEKTSLSKQYEILKNAHDTKSAEYVQQVKELQEKLKNLEKPTVSRGSAPPTGKALQMTATAYTAYCKGCSGTTATGINLRENPSLKVIAVDPKIIPLGSKVWVEGYGYAIAGDTGGAIKGNKVDLFMPNRQDALNWGRRTVTVKIVSGS